MNNHESYHQFRTTGRGEKNGGNGPDQTGVKA